MAFAFPLFFIGSTVELECYANKKLPSDVSVRTCSRHQAGKYLIRGLVM
jgi:hypothetical protein